MSSSNSKHLFAATIEVARSLLHRPWEVRFRHTLREGNEGADFMAKLGNNSDELWRVWDSPPPGLGTILSADARRVVFLQD